MTKKELLEGIKTKMNPAEFETMGLTLSDSKDMLQDIYDGLHVHREKTNEPVDPELPETPAEEETPAEITETPEAPEEEVPAEQAGTDSFDEMMNKIQGAAVPPKAEKKEKPFAERKTRKSKKGASDPEATRIEGFILLIAVDTLFPFSLAFLNNMLDKKGKRVEPKDLQLDQKSFDKLEPLADQAADYLSFNINPVAGFFIASSLMYANNLIQIKMTKD
jgi:hypothetical protein